MASSTITTVDRELASRFEEHLMGTPEFAEEAAAEEAPVAAPAVEEEPEEELAEAPLTEGDEQAQEAAPAEEAEPAVEEESIQTVSELAEAYEIEEQELLDHLQIEGRDGEMVPLAEVVQGYRTQPENDITRSSEIEALKVEFRTEHDAGMTELRDLTASLITKIKGHREPEGGWEALRSSDPGEYLRLQELQKADRYDAEQAIGLMERESQKEAAVRQEAEDRYVEGEKKQIFVLHPEWRNENAGRAAFNDIQAYAAKYNYGDEQMRLASAADISTLWKAAQHEKLTKDKKVIKKRLRGLPARHVKASARDEAGPQREQKKKRDAYLDNYRKTGKIEDGIELFKEFID